MATMIDCDASNEFLIIGSFKDGSGKIRKHASTFIRMQCGRNKTPVVVHLDSNCDKPQSTNPMLIDRIKESDLLAWEQFERYFEISVYTLEDHLIMDPAAFNERLEFAKDIIEGKVKGAPAIDADVMHEEMSARGSRGKQASSKSSLSLTSRPKKSKRFASMESQLDACLLYTSDAADE